jgi:hypothetical protein
VQTEQSKEPEKVADPTLAELTKKWLVEVGPRLLQIARTRELTRYEARMMEAVKSACICHRTDTPRDFAKNGEDCEICGRKIYNN